MDNNFEKNLRVKNLRKKLNLTLEEFGKNLGIKKSALSRIENNSANLTDKLLISICNVYNVNEDWLRNGIGKMFNQTKQNLIDEVSEIYNFDDLDRTIFSEYVSMNKKDRDVIKKYILSVVNSYTSKNEVKEETEEEKINREVEAYRKELESESKGAEKLYEIRIKNAKFKKIIKSNDNRKS